MAMRVVWALLNLLILIGLVGGAAVKPFRRDVGHPRWHHGNFEDVTSRVRQEAKKLLHSRANVPFRVPLEVNIVLVGFNGDAGFRFTMDPEALAAFMKKTFPNHRPACLETGQPLDVEHDINYNVIPVGTSEVLALEWELRRLMAPAGTARENEWGREIPVFEVEATELEATWDMFYNYLFDVDHSSVHDMNKLVPNAIFITNFDKVRMDPREGNDTSYDILMNSKVEPLSLDEMYKQEGGYLYRYRYNGGAATQVWLGKGRFAVIDLSAGPCVYGKVESEEGSVGYRAVQRLHTLLFPRRVSPVKVTDIEASFRGYLSALIVSAIEHVISPDVRFDYVDPATRLLVPILAFRNHQRYNPMEPGANYSIDMHSVEAQVKKLAPPGQEVVVVGGVLNLHDHEKLAIAAMNALRSHSIHETRNDGRFHARARTYLDAALLRDEMRHSTDVLAATLLESADPSSSPRFFRRDKGNVWEMPTPTRPEGELSDDDSVVKSTSARFGTRMKNAKEGGKKGPQAKPPVEKQYGTRVLPVFVFSLADVDPDLLMEGEDLVFATHDAVFVLQHDNDRVNLSYVSDKRWRVGQAVSPMRHIIAGLASAVGGLAAPYERASHVHERPMHNWLWASGHHPFGPFTNTSSVSQLLADTALRNAIYARVDIALRKIREANVNIDTFKRTYLLSPLMEKIKDAPKKSRSEAFLDVFYKKSLVLPLSKPQDAVDRLESYIDGLVDQLVKLAEMLYDHRLRDAFGNSTSVVRSSMFTQDYVDHVLSKEKDNMRCCKRDYEAPTQSSLAFVYGGIMVAGFLVYFLVIYFSASER